jgi:hypothetical protein
LTYSIVLTDTISMEGPPILPSQPKIKNVKLEEVLGRSYYYGEDLYTICLPIWQSNRSGPSPKCFRMVKNYRSYKIQYWPHNGTQWCNMSVNPKKVTYHSRRQQAFRNTIRKQLSSFRKSHPMVCNYCGLQGVYMDIDHIVPFAKLVEDFLQEYNYKSPRVRGIQTNNYYEYHIVNKKIERQWFQYHLKHAELQWLCTKCHKAKSKASH